MTTGVGGVALRFAWGEAPSELRGAGGTGRNGVAYTNTSCSA